MEFQSYFQDITKKKSIKREKLSLLFNITISFLIINLSLKTTYLFSDKFIRITIFLLEVLLLYNIHYRNIKSIYKNIYKITIITLLFILSFIILYLNTDTISLLISTSLFFTTILIIDRNNKYKEFIPLTITIILLSYIWFTLNHIPLTWLFLQKLSLNLSTFFNIHLNTQTNIGPSFYLLIFISPIIYTLISHIKSNNKNKTIRYLMLIFILSHIIYTLSIYYLDVINEYAFYSIQAILLFLYAISSIKIIEHCDFKINIKFNNETNKIHLMIAIIVIFCSLYNISNLNINYTNQNKKIVFLKEGIVDWYYPDFSKYGLKTIGMFGCLPEILRCYGFETGFLDSPINGTSLLDINSLVIINLNRTFDPCEIDAIWNFVENGGSLLVLGDHTDFQGIMNNTNLLLKPVNIAFRFDAAFPFRDEWLNCLQFFPHPITSNMHNDYNIKWRVGASLDIDYPASPIIVGRYGFSDTGDYKNVEEAYLGNYLLDAGEQLGDLVLAAEAIYGKGKVIVFGDTSSLQNPCLPHNHRFIYQIFAYLTNGKNVIPNLVFNILIIFLSILFVTLHKLKYTTIFIIAILLIFFANTAVRILYFQTYSTPVIYSDKIAFIDNTHCNLFSFDEFTDSSIEGLIYNIYRNGHIPMILNSFNSRNMDNSKVIFIIAPTKPFNNREIITMKNYLHKGGTVVLSLGWNEKKSLKQLMNEFHFNIEPIPLGPYPYIDVEFNFSNTEISFSDSWIISSDETFETLYTTEIAENEYKLIISKKIGFGELIIIGDGEFLLNNNLEGVNDWHLGNIYWIRDLFKNVEVA